MAILNNAIVNGAARFIGDVYFNTLLEASVASTDRIMIYDASDPTRLKKGPTFGTSTTTYLRNDGTWGTPAGTGSGGTGEHNHDDTYLKLTGGTLTGVLKLANNTYNEIGDDVKIGDINVSGALGVKGINAETGIALVNRSNSYYTKLTHAVATANQTITFPDLSGNVVLLENMREAYLKWGGKNFAADYGCIDAAMIPDLGANRLALFSNKVNGITIEYSRDSGATWLDYEATVELKANLFNGNGTSLYLGKANTKSETIVSTNDRLRITIDTPTASIYTKLNKFAIYVSTRGCGGCTCTIRAVLESDRAAGNYDNKWVTFAQDVPVSGWSGWNVINIDDMTTYSNQPSVQYNLVTFTFKCTSVASTTSNIGLEIIKILGFGGVGWGTPSNLARFGRMYTFDYQLNCTFPGALYTTGTVVARATTNSFEVNRSGSNAAALIKFTNKQGSAERSSLGYIGMNVVSGNLLRWKGDNTGAYTIYDSGNFTSGTGATNYAAGNHTHDTYVAKTGDEMTGTLTVPIVLTGEADGNYFQARKFRGQGNAATYYHAIDFGYTSHNLVDFYEYGGVWNFWKNTTETATSNTTNLCLKITDTGLLNKNNTFTFPSTGGTFELTGHTHSEYVDKTTALSINGNKTFYGKTTLTSVDLMGPTNLLDNVTVSTTAPNACSVLKFSSPNANDGNSARTEASITLDYAATKFIFSTRIDASSFYLTSDIRKKNVLELLTLDNSKVAELPIFNFQWKDTDDISVYSGTSALSVLELLPNVVGKDEVLTLDYASLGTILGINAAREIEKLKKRIKELEEKLWQK